MTPSYKSGHLKDFEQRSDKFLKHHSGSCMEKRLWEGRQGRRGTKKEAAVIQAKDSGAWTWMIAVEGAKFWIDFKGRTNGMC